MDIPLWKSVPDSEHREIYADVTRNLGKKEKELVKVLRKRNQTRLADKNSQYYRDKKTKAIEQAKKSLHGARMGTNRPGSALVHMSPAAQRLASGKLGIRLGTDQVGI